MPIIFLHNQNFTQDFFHIKSLHKYWLFSQEYTLSLQKQSFLKIQAEFCCMRNKFLRWLRSPLCHKCNYKYKFVFCIHIISKCLYITDNESLFRCESDHQTLQDHQIVGICSGLAGLISSVVMAAFLWRKVKVFKLWIYRYIHSPLPYQFLSGTIIDLPCQSFHH